MTISVLQPMQAGWSIATTKGANLPFTHTGHQRCAGAAFRKHDFSRSPMDRRLLDLLILALLSAFLCALAFVYDQPFPTLVFAALTCAIGVIAALLRRFF
jgi:hypothetical protein